MLHLKVSDIDLKVMRNAGFGLVNLLRGWRWMVLNWGAGQQFYHWGGQIGWVFLVSELLMPLSVQFSEGYFGFKIWTEATEWGQYLFSEEFDNWEAPTYFSHRAALDIDSSLDRHWRYPLPPNISIIPGVHRFEPLLCQKIGISDESHQDRILTLNHNENCCSNFSSEEACGTFTVNFNRKRTEGRMLPFPPTRDQLGKKRSLALMEGTTKELSRSFQNVFLLR